MRIWFCLTSLAWWTENVNERHTTGGGSVLTLHLKNKTKSDCILIKATPSLPEIKLPLVERPADAIAGETEDVPLMSPFTITTADLEQRGFERHRPTYRMDFFQQMQDSSVNVFSLPYNCLNNTFFSVAYFNGRIQ